MSQPTPGTFDLRGAARHLRRLAAGADLVEAGSRLYEALGARHADRARLERVLADPLGPELLSSRPAIGTQLRDAAYLSSLSPGSVGLTYFEWAKAKQISVDALQAATSPSYPESGDDRVEYLRTRARDLHDVFHVVTGYDTDVLGEVALLAFTAFQNHSRAHDRLSLLGCAYATCRGRFDALELRAVARRRAREAPYLLVQDWAALLPAPLEQVRRRLRLTPPPVYVRLATT